MISQDLGFRIKELTERILVIENRLGDLTEVSKEREDWDNATLIHEWGICKRTAANYRKKGLRYFKRGGRVFYTAESREKFIKKRKEVRNGKS